MMSKIDGLVERLCPDGVEWRALGDVVSYVNEKVPSKVINEGCYVGVNELRQDCRGRNRELRAPVEERCTAFHPGDILLGNIRPYLKKLWLADCAGGTNGDVLVLRVKDTSAMLPSFLWHILAGSAFTRYNIEHSKGAKMPRGDKKAILNYIVPVPPMEVQEEIVRVLDSFAEQEAELEKMLVAELEARKAQYAYYRDKLLDFGSRGGVRWVTLGELGLFRRGKRFTVDDYVESGIGSIHYGEIYTKYGLSAEQCYSFLPTKMESQLRFAEKGELVIAATGENVEDLCKSVVWSGTEKVAVHDDCYIFRSDEDPKYIAHTLLTNAVMRQKKMLVSNGKVSRISGKNLGRIVIPIPALEEQQRIVAVLDEFDALVNDISHGLPAEIEARRKQYAYYRDKLLAFPEKAA